MSGQRTVPGANEVREQLARILGSDTFAKKHTLRPLLERLMRDNLEGTVGGDGYEQRLAAEVWKESDWSPVLSGKVRQNVANLRDGLDTYYSAEGAEDPIRISFPSGYQAVFDHRHGHDVKDSVEWLAGSCGNAFPDRSASDYFVSQLQVWVREHPSYAPGYAFLAEAILASSLCDDTHPSRMSAAVRRAEEFAKAGMALNNGLWRMHVVAGAIHGCRFAWNEADASFKAALRLAPDEVRNHFWYAAFLLSVGRTDEAKQTVLSRSEASRVVLRPYILPLLRYLLRQFQHAHRTLALETPFSHAAADATSRLMNVDIHVPDEWHAKMLTSCLVQAMTSDLPRNSKTELQGTLPSGAIASTGIHWPAARIADPNGPSDGTRLLRLWLNLWPLFDALVNPPQEHPGDFIDKTFEFMLTPTKGTP